MSRLDALRYHEFDIAVVGGGLAGAGAARDAALRGFSVALFERADYGGGSTSRSSRLIESGLASIERGGPLRIRAELRERDVLIGIAPHLVKPVEVLIPFYGLTLFRQWKALALTAVFAPSGRRVVSRAELLRQEPALRAEGLEGGLVYQDALLESPERLCVENIADAGVRGAILLNYAEVRAISNSAGGYALRVRDLVDSDEAEVRARVVINAVSNSGPATHCALPALSGRPICLFSPAGERLFHLAPVAGITQAGHSGAGGSVRELLDVIARFVPEAAFAPLYWTNVETAHCPKLPPSSGLIAIGNGKPGTYRPRAERAVDAAARRLGVSNHGTTAGLPFPGASAPPPDLPAQVKRAVRDEQCLFLEDFMRRRSTLSLGEDQGLGAAPRVAREMAAQLGWNAGRIEAESIHYQQWVLRTREPMRRLGVPGC